MNPPPYFSPSQAKEFKTIVRRLKKARLLAKVDPALVIGLALACDEARVASRFLEENGRSFQVRKPGRPYKCPICKGTGLGRARSGKPCVACRGRGVLVPTITTVRLEHHEARILRWAIDAIQKLTVALGLAPNAIPPEKKP